MIRYYLYLYFTTEKYRQNSPPNAWSYVRALASWILPFSIFRSFFSSVEGSFSQILSLGFAFSSQFIEWNRQIIEFYNIYLRSHFIWDRFYVRAFVFKQILLQNAQSMVKRIYAGTAYTFVATTIATNVTAVDIVDFRHRYAIETRLSSSFYFLRHNFQARLATTIQIIRKTYDELVLLVVLGEGRWMFTIKLWS